MSSHEMRLEINPHLDPIKQFMWHKSLYLFNTTSRLTLPEIDMMHNLIDLPTDPYDLLVNIPENYSRISVPQLRETLTLDRRGLTLVEGLHLATSLRNTIKVVSVDLFSTETIRNGIRHTLTLTFNERQKLEIGLQNAVKDDYENPPFIFALTCKIDRS